MRRFLCFFLVLAVCFCAACAEDGFTGFVEEDVTAECPPAEYTFTGKRVSAQYASDTAVWTIESFTWDRAFCLLTKLWVKDPARQIRKVNAPWGEDLGWTPDLALQVPGTILAVNASGFITKAYPEIPENWPGESADYYNTTLGSLVVTDGEILRNLEDVPYYGLALTEGGIVLYRGADNGAVLAAEPVQTWAFYENCALQVNGEDLLPEEGTWSFAKTRAARTVIARVDRNNYLLLTVPYRDDSYGLSLYSINRFFSENFETEWVYNLDGGYSTGLYYRTDKENARLTMLIKSTQRVADVLCITE